MANVLGRGVIKIGDGDTYKAVKKLYVKKGPEWKDAKTAWVKQNGEWIQVYPTPIAESVFVPTTLSYETYNGYQSNVQYVSISNTGTENLIIEEFTTTYTAFGKFVEFFDLTELGGTLPATIAPGETKRLGIGIDGGEVGSSDATIRIKTNVGALGTEYKEYAIYGNVLPPYSEADVLPGLNADLEYFRYNPQQTRQEFRVKNIGTGSLIITSVEGVGPYFNVISYPDAIAPREYGIIVIESRVDDNVQPGIYTDVITVKSNNISGDIRLDMTLDVMFPEGNTRISTAGVGKFVVPEGVYRLSEVRVIGGGGGGGQGFNQQAIPAIPNPNPSVLVDYLIVGGGGGGGGYVGGGGGGGGVAIGSTSISQGSLVSVIVGQGGAGGETYQAGKPGGNSSFNNIAVNGGGGGSSTGTTGGADLGENAGIGGSGGGASSFTNTINNNSLKSAGNGTSGQGFPGGTAESVSGSSSENRGYGAGGGGAGGPGGTTATWTVGGAGGPGLASDITGTTRLYGAGGGGASHQTNVNTTGGAGGNYGGGAGSNVLGNSNDAINFTGAGGGGAGGIGNRNGAGGRGGSGIVVARYQNAKQICSGGDVTSYSRDGLTYWVHSFTSSSTFTYAGLDPVLSGGVNSTPVIVPGAGAGGGGGSGSIVLVANVDVMPGEVIEYVVGRGGAGVEPILSTTNPAASGKPGETTSFKNGLVAAGGGLGGGGGGPNTGGVGAGNTPNPRITGVGLVPRTLSWAWSGHMNTYAVWDNPSDAANAWSTVRKFTPTATDNYTFHLSCDNYGVLYLNGPAILSTTSFSSVTRTTVYIQKDTVNIISMYAQNWGGPCGYALHVTDSAGRVVWDTRTYRAAETIESLPGAVSRRGGVGQNGTAGIGNGGHGGSNTFGLGGTPGLYRGTPAGVGRGPGTGGGGGASGIDGQITPASGAGADGEVYIAWGPIVPRDPPQNLIAHFVVSIEEQRMYDRVLPYCNPYVMQVSGFFTEKDRPYALFNGTSANYIGTPADAKYDLVRATNSSFTIEAWVILKGTGSAGVWGGEIINRDAEYEVAINGNDQVIVAIDWGVGTDVNLPGSGWIIPPAGRATIPRNLPTHIAVVANQSTLLIYINGVLSFTTSLNRVARRDNTPVWIGNRPGQSQAFNGGIADVRIWNVARTQAQIQENMTALVYNTPQGI